MARGATSKEKITETILATFPGSFKYNKEIRIPMTEDGELIQIKCTLTAAKENVEGGNEDVSPEPVAESVSPKPSVPEPSAEEKQAVVDLMSKLGLA